MKNIHDILAEYGLTVPEDKKAEFDKAVTENYKTTADYDKQAGKLKLAEEKAQTTADALKKFDGVDVSALQGEVQKMKDDLAAKDTDYQHMNYRGGAYDRKLKAMGMQTAVGE